MATTRNDNSVLPSSYLPPINSERVSYTEKKSQAMASLSAQSLLCIALTVVICLIGGVDGSLEGGQREFDYFALSLQWPGTICHGTRHCCSSNACCRGANSPTEFTIHGLWPDYNDGTWPSCCAQVQFDVKEISTLLDALEKYWPSLYCGQSSTCYSGRGLFWAHEWEKHGTCSFPVFRDEYSYFLTTLNVYFKYNVTKILNEAGYVPSNSERYPLGGIVSAIENSFQATPEVVCSKDAVEEIRLCFYKDFKPRNCLASKTSCPKYVSFPAYVSFGRDESETDAAWTSEDEAL
ncbi:PREDICTED: ribonuclease 2 [Theobroma cacao]|uniref:Ribonuclease 2 n=1 Tax=Theobroma cacao TaxID=3641 RepID=A0AB32WRT8_THECC|nr:PREDICTED: ribonuclease 2 [Theobroma cacao]